MSLSCRVAESRGFWAGGALDSAIRQRGAVGSCAEVARLSAAARKASCQSVSRTFAGREQRCRLSFDISDCVIGGDSFGLMPLLDSGACGIVRPPTVPESPDDASTRAHVGL